MPNNTLLTPDQITLEALRILHQKSTFLSTIHKGYDNSFANAGAKIGDQLRIRLPNQYLVRDGRVRGAAGDRETNERQVTLKIDTYKGVDMDFTSEDLTLDLDDFSKRIIAPATAALASTVEADVLRRMRKAVWQQVGDAGTPVVLRTFLEGRQALQEALAPDDKRYALLSPGDNVDIVTANSGLFQSASEIDKQYKKGYMGMHAGFTFMESTHMERQIRGGADANYVADSGGAGDQSGAVLAVSGGVGTLLEGDVFTIEGVNRVHPETKVNTGKLQQFVVTEDFAGGAGAISIAPAIEFDGAYQNVTSAAADGAVIEIQGVTDVTYGQSMVYCPEAFTFATADLVKPKGVDMCSVKDYDGISMRLIRDYDSFNDVLGTRLDILYGALATRPQLASRIATQ